MAKDSKKASKPAVKKAAPTVAATEVTKPKRTAKKPQTVRERTQAGDGRARRIRTSASRVKTPIKKIRQTGKREYHLPLPDNRIGKVGSKRVRLVPKFVREAWHEIKLVTWPTFRETLSLTFAVFLFSIVFALIVGVLDFGLDKLFKELIVKR